MCAAVLDEMVEAVEALGMEVHIVHGEFAPSQFELSIVHAEALRVSAWDSVACWNGVGVMYT